MKYLGILKDVHQMIRFHDRTIYIIIGNLKLEIWLQMLLNWEYLRVYLIPSLELILRDYIYGFMLNSNWIIFNAGLSLQYMTKEEKEDIMKELGESD